MISDGRVLREGLLVEEDRASIRSDVNEAVSCLDPLDDFRSCFEPDDPVGAWGFFFMDQLLEADLVSKFSWPSIDPDESGQCAFDQVLWCSGAREPNG